MKIISLVLVYVVSVVSALSATYYVDRGSGSNLNDGLSEATAWYNMSKVESYSLSPGFAPGDQILFKRGYVYSYKINFKSSGASGNPIVMGAYGTGSDPILAGTSGIPGANVSTNWTSVGTNTWRIDNISSDPTRLWLNGVEYVEANAAASDPVSLIDSQYRWYYDATNSSLYVYATTNPATAYSGTSGLQAYLHELEFIGVSHITVKDLDIAGGSYGAILIMDGAHDITIENCTIRRSCIGILVQGMDSNWNSSPCFNLVFRNNVIDSEANYSYNYEYLNIRDGIYLRLGCYDVEISGNTFKDWGHSDVNIFEDRYQTKRINIYNNTFYGQNISYSRAFGYSVKGTGETADIKFFRNNIYDKTTRNQICGSNVLFYDNLIDTVTQSPARLTDYRGTAQGLNLYSTDSSGPTTNNIIAFNTIINCEEPGLSLWNLNTTSNPEDMENNWIINNTITNCGTSIGGTGSYSHLSGISLDVEETNITGSITNNKFMNNTFSDTSSYDVYYKGTAYTSANFNLQDGQSGNVIYGND